MGNTRLQVGNFLFTAARGKTNQKHSKKGKDVRKITLRKKAFAGEGLKEQLWDVKDMDLAFDLWEGNKDREKPLSNLAISKQTGIPYTTLCEWLSGRRGSGHRVSKVLDKGKQVGSQVSNQMGSQVGISISHNSLL